MSLRGDAEGDPPKLQNANGTTGSVEETRGEKWPKGEIKRGLRGGPFRFWFAGIKDRF